MWLWLNVYCFILLTENMVNVPFWIHFHDDNQYILIILWPVHPVIICQVFTFWHIFCNDLNIYFGVAFKFHWILQDSVKLVGGNVQSRRTEDICFQYVSSWFSGHDVGQKCIHNVFVQTFTPDRFFTWFYDWNYFCWFLAMIIHINPLIWN